MTEDRSFSLAAPTNNLRRLMVIRGLLISALCIALISSYFALHLVLPYSVLGLILTGITAINLLTWLRLQKPWPVTELEFFSQLLLDALCISLMLYFSGGANNPFVSYYLVPLCIAAATLSWNYAALLTAISVAAYTILLVYHIPIEELSPMSHHHQLTMVQEGTSHGMNHGASQWNMHTLGMWINFMASALLISYFVVQMARNIRGQDQALTRLREEEMLNQQLMAVATLAAGTAHELGTPLSTIKTLLSEMQDDYPDKPELQEDLKLLQSQLVQCDHTLKNLINRAEQSQAGNQSKQDLHQYCEDIIEQWLIMRPEVEANIQLAESCPERQVSFDATIGQSILNLLNNAADACPTGIDVDICWTRDEFILTIDDNGPGIPLEIAEQLGKPFVSTKGKGFGLGLFLSHASISRHGGEIKLYNRDNAGTHTELRLPLSKEIS
ncbi:ATP-binding protein [Pseudoteredinibacter isoporae]|uniref:histidine kinase n=1 Tax=Pseudoteredinibacter isoporae TaxID=570281 RepID=A0A7X0JW16_9GAMM|nr:ATP-binding protein [Pseudoteredinibacter isoporae]MBB6522839.1 two-component system sensor histidine kinase RegB [Pseudoteredinibacter isoporae]NHO88366.1 HAMP domain-containing histidine kinase [Pseudoteredinibacter isoporae]NIB23303.1 HAMP domain-containing histidine kinase [Pseudoteredinibacter isoporae]